MSNPARTDPAHVQAILVKDYDAVNQVDLTPYIATASAVVDRVVSDAQTKKNITLSDGPHLVAGDSIGTEAELIERWLAAHFYAVSDKPYTQKSTDKASASFNGQTAQGFEATLYGQMAMRVDWSQCLRNLDQQQRARGVWLGKPPSQQIDYDQRN